ncbi:MAG TPA: ABC transporter substrate-binding protein [Clostridiales bacterium]|nr:ABC transporter substrate-binding protein [Clostridiales bacterium]
MKKFLSILLVMCMVLGLFTACAKEEESVTGKETTGSGTEVTEAPTAEPVQELKDVNVIMWTLNTVPTEIDLVEEAINKITEPEIGVTVHLNIMDMGTYLTQASMMVTNNEKVDLMITFPAASAHYSVMSSQGMLTPLNDLLNEYGQDLLAELPDFYLDGTTKEGKILSVPCYKNLISDMYWVARTSVLENSGVDPANIKTMADVENAMVEIHKANPEMITLGGNAKTVNLTYPGQKALTGGHYDTLGEATAIAAIADFDNPTKVVSRYETEEWLESVSLLKKWYDMGLIDKDLANKEGAGEPLADSNVATSFVIMNATKLSSYDTTIGDKLTYVKLSDGVISTGALTQMTWAVPSSATEPEAAVKLMNMLFTDARIVNLFDYGVEGTHYVKKDDGTIGFPEGIDASTSGYYINMVQLIGNAFLAHTWEGGDPNDAAKGKAIMENAEASPILGFSLDTSKVSDIYAQLSALCNDQYRPALVCGSAPADYQEKFIKAMQDAGLEQYLAEAQRQLDEWLAAKK